MLVNKDLTGNKYGPKEFVKMFKNLQEFDDFWYEIIKWYKKCQTDTDYKF